MGEDKNIFECFSDREIHHASLELVRSYRILKQSGDDQTDYFKLLNVLNNLIYAFEIVKMHLDYLPPFLCKPHQLQCDNYQKELNLKINTFDNYLKLRLESLLKAQPASIKAEQINELVHATFESVGQDTYIDGWKTESNTLVEEATNFMKKIIDECQSRNPILIEWLLKQL